MTDDDDTGWVVLRDGNRSGATIEAGRVLLAEGDACYGLDVRTLGENVGTVLRVWRNNGQDPGLTENNVLVSELSLPPSNNEGGWYRRHRVGEPSGVDDEDARDVLPVKKFDGFFAVWGYPETLQAGQRLYATLDHALANGIKVRVLRRHPFPVS